ncbi:exported protein of unknown function [Candidatus Hydrogenisulfobacillus filiaventi]|uniref:Uncharacterized protein n=1 Tax=Candidatus Hydrogenisulfobacillus filiaventi TaxID=2707344 RepID=A0A6F8ZJ67_9FIRM|nr:hypothetical protein [Bacillota bacterium]CAB1129704.1 exported protein of unknown function [Candidatus Hydrogenisulfobacillus filiaventi]
MPLWQALALVAGFSGLMTAIWLLLPDSPAAAPPAHPAPGHRRLPDGWHVLPGGRQPPPSALSSHS